jgi:adenosine deaminase
MWLAADATSPGGAMSDLRQLIAEIPKAELHLHIEGTLEPELKFDLAARNGIQLPYRDVDAMRAAYDFDDLSSFLAQYYEGMSVLLHEPDFYDLTMAYLRKAREQGVVYAEMFFDPQAHTTRGVGFATVINGIRRAQLDAATELGIRTQLIMCFLRDMSADSAMATLEASLPHREWILGVGLDSDEQGNPPVKFRDVFARARSEEYRLTMHCDVDQENSLEHIRQCLDVIGVDRIDHGVNSVEDPELCAEIVDRGLGLTVCPISNSYVAGGLKDRQLATMLERNMRACINSDDPAYFPGYVADNLLAVTEAAGFGEAEVRRLVANGFAAAWLDEIDRARYVDAVNAFGV